MRRLAVLAVFAACCGCTGQNPSYFPFLLPQGNIVRTHAKPAGPGNYADFDPHAVRLEVRPREIIGPTGTQHVILATVYDEKNQPRRQRRVEWLLEGVGHILEVDESGIGPGRGYKVDNRYGVSFTDFFEHTFTRGTRDPADDFTVRPGQTYCVVTSNQEGETHLTAYAPEIGNWEAHKIVVTLRWVDTECVLPPASVQRAGSSFALKTQVLRKSDKQPQANYRVRYKLLDGPPIRLTSATGSASGDPSEATASSDTAGVAIINVAQAAAAAGVSRVGVEVVKPATEPGGPEVVVAKGETTLEWEAPGLALQLQVPPVAQPGQEVPFHLTLRSTGRFETQPATVKLPLLPGWKIVRSDPPASVEGDQAVWTLDGLAPGKEQRIVAVLTPTAVGKFTTTASAVTSDGLHAESQTALNVAAAELKLTITGPPGGAIGEALTWQIAVTNTGSAAATNLQVRDGFDAGLEHETKANPLDLTVPRLEPGQTETIPLVLTAKQAGKFVNRAIVVADGGLKGQAEAVVTISERALDLKLNGPASAAVDQDVNWELTVTNAGDAPLANVLVRHRLPPEVEFARASAGGRHAPAQGAVEWYLGALGPREARLLQLTGIGRQAAAKVESAATVSSEGRLERTATHALALTGTASPRLDVVALQNPIEARGVTTFRIRVENRGALPAEQVEVRLTAPAGVTVVRGGGAASPKIDGATATFPPVARVEPKQTLEYTVELQPNQPGDWPVRVELRSPALNEPLTAQDVLRVVPGAK